MGMRAVQQVYLMFEDKYYHRPTCIVPSYTPVCVSIGTIMYMVPRYIVPAVINYLVPWMEAIVKLSYATV